MTDRSLQPLDYQRRKPGRWARRPVWRILFDLFTAAAVLCGGLTCFIIKNGIQKGPPPSAALAPLATPAAADFDLSTWVTVLAICTWCVLWWIILLLLDLRRSGGLRQAGRIADISALLDSRAFKRWLIFSVLVISFAVIIWCIVGEAQRWPAHGNVIDILFGSGDKPPQP